MWNPYILVPVINVKQDPATTQVQRNQVMSSRPSSNEFLGTGQENGLEALSRCRKMSHSTLLNKLKSLSLCFVIPGFGAVETKINGKLCLNAASQVNICISCLFSGQTVLRPIPR